MRPSQILPEKRGEVLKIAEKYSLKNLRVIDSVARGEDDEKSDLDLLVLFPDGFTLLDLVDLINDMELVLDCKVDIASERGLKERIKSQIFKEAVPV